MPALLIAIMILFAHAVSAYQYADNAAIAERIKPIGQVRIQEDVQVPSSEPKAAADSASSQTAAKKPASPGQKIYEQYCATCHSTGLAGAPRFQSSEDWASRMKEKNIEGLTKTAIQGINAMPAKGTCMSCSEADIRAAVEYMLPK